MKCQYFSPHAVNFTDFRLLYDKPWIRCPPYLIGILGGWFSFKHMDSLRLYISRLSVVSVLMYLHVMKIMCLHFEYMSVHTVCTVYSAHCKVYTLAIVHTAQCTVHRITFLNTENRHRPWPLQNVTKHKIIPKREMKSP